MSSDELANALDELSRVARALTEAARADPVRDLADLTKAARAFVVEARRDRPGLRDAIADAETAVRMAQARLARIRSAAG